MVRGVGVGLFASLLAALPALATTSEITPSQVVSRPANQAVSFNQIYAVGDVQVRALGQFSRSRAYLSHQQEIWRANGKGLDRVQIVAQLPQAGHYRLYGWWPLDEQAGVAELRVTDKRGSHKQAITLKTDAGQWRELGTYEFAAGLTEIEWREQHGSLLFDALRIEYVGERAAPLVLAVDKLPLIETGVAYQAPIVVSGGVAPHTFSISAGKLPSGLQLDGKTGLVRGRTEQLGHFDLVISMTDSRGQRGSGHLKLDVVDGDPLAQTEAMQQSQLAGRSVSSRQKRATLTGQAEPMNDQADLSELLAAIAATPDGEWLRANLNLYAEVWAPAALRPLNNSSNPEPSKIIGAWSGFAWDSNRGDLLLYGGGHANYSGNDVYRWRGSTRMWERASLPSEVIKDIRNHHVAIDGTDNAPASAHTYDNNIFLPLHDRMLALGGAAYNNGGMFMRAVDAATSRKTGPYLFDPSKADPNKVGGSTGSHVQRVAPYPEIVGGNMWQNRDMFLHLAGTPKLPASHVEGCTGYAEEDGRDVVYIGARLGGTATSLFRYVITDLANPALDVWQQVGGYWNGPQGQMTCAYDAEQRVFLRTGSATRPFVYWDVNTPGPTNYEKYPLISEPTGEFNALLTDGTIKLRDCGLDFDPLNRRYALWCGGNQLWFLTPPETVGIAGWQLAKAPTPLGVGPTAVVGTGILGKWKYIPNLQAFMALQDASQGNVWIYKPVGWQPPVGDDNLRPTVSLLSPQAGQEFIAGDPITVSASATDLDGSIDRVEFYDGSELIGSDSEAPYELSWTTAPTGNRTLLARAYDDDGASGNSATVAITVLPGASGTVELQDGLGGYAGSRDTYLSTFSKASNYGASVLMYDQGTSYVPLLKFAIFQREGGPVPDNAVIQSAELRVYKFSSYDPRYALHRMLRDWDESQASWNLVRTGESWSVAGAAGADSDYRAQADAEASATWSASWIVFDVSGALQAMQNGEPNYGWRLRRISGDSANLKKFHSSEATADASKRPMLVVTYSAP